MNKVVAFLGLLLASFSLAAQNPITIESSDIFSAGDTLHSMRDLFPNNFTIGNAGANQTWDFSSLVGDASVTNYVVDPSTTPYASNFTGSTVALTTDFSNYLFAKVDAQAETVQGFAGDILGIGLITFVKLNPTVDQLRFNVAYGNSYSGTYKFTKTVSYNNLPTAVKTAINNAISGIPLVESVKNVRVSFTSNYTDIIDSWGKATTPLGTYDCLRQKRTEATTTVFEAELEIGVPPFTTTSWQEIDRRTGNSTDYWWLTKVTKEPLIAIEYDTLRNITAVRYSLTPPPAPNNAPVAGMDTGSVTYPDNIVLDVLANDMDTDGNTLTVQSIAQLAANGTATINPNGTISYQPNQGFSGIDSFTYVVCDDVIPPMCDTALVVIDVDFSSGISEALDRKMNIYPNPASNHFQIDVRLSESSDPLYLQVHNSMGSIVIKEMVTDSRIYVTELPAGVYLTILSNKNGETITSQKLVIVK